MTDPIISRPTPWSSVILVCGKCSRKLDGGYGPKGSENLRTTLKEALKERGHRRAVRVIETKCFGLCPKRAVVALNATNPSQLLTIPRGTETGEVLEKLFQTTAQ